MALTPGIEDDASSENLPRSHMRERETGGDRPVLWHLVPPPDRCPPPRTYSERQDALTQLAAGLDDALASHGDERVAYLRSFLLLGIDLVRANALAPHPYGAAREAVLEACESTVAAQSAQDDAAAPGALRDCDRIARYLLPADDEPGLHTDMQHLELMGGDESILTALADIAAALCRRTVSAHDCGIAERELEPVLRNARNAWAERRGGQMMASFPDTPGTMLAALFDAARLCEQDAAGSADWLVAAGGCVAVAERYATWAAPFEQKFKDRIAATPPGELVLKRGACVLARSDLCRQPDRLAAADIGGWFLSGVVRASGEWLDELMRRRQRAIGIFDVLVERGALALVAAWAVARQRAAT